MKTIGAKELRLRLEEVFDRVLQGEDIVVNHRFKGPIRLTAALAPAHPSNKKLAGLQAFDAAPKRRHSFDAHKPIKELYDESISKKYVGQSRVS